jgi:UDP-N-acetylmuramyl tripeptide synthase
MARIASPAPTSAPAPARPSVYESAVRGAARLARGCSRGLRLGGGTSLPGLVIERLAPSFVERRAAALPSGVVVVSGTNGKTTTVAMIASILEGEGHTVITNSSGANLFRGVATALLDMPDRASVGVFEVDEGALPRLVPALRPSVLVLTNVFRDQLDRFGEPETVAGLMADAVGQLPAGSTVVANADDPLLWHSVRLARRLGFGVRSGRTDSADAPSPPESGGEPEICPACGSGLRYRERTVAHLGASSCPRCGWSTAPPRFRADVRGPVRLGSMAIVIAGRGLLLPMGGLHNAYNAAAAVAAASAMGVPVGRAAHALEGFHAKFGRSEELELDGTPLRLVLMKNPAGAAALLQQVCAEPRVGSVVVAVSDRPADGRDISWIWDAPFERLAPTRVPVVAAGRRAAEVALRLKYAGIQPSATAREPLAALRTAVTAARGRGPVVVLATYSAMLDVRRAVLGSRSASVADAA